MRRSLPGVVLFVAVGVFGCDKTNDVTATSVNCGDDAIKCVPCEAGSLDCDGATLLRCRPDGRGYGVEAECETAPLCAEGLSLGACQEPLCAPGEASCVGAVMQVCAAGQNRLDLRVCGSEDACLRGLEERACAEVACSAATDCTGNDTECRRRACVEGRCEIENLPGDVACTLGGVNGVCDGEGACRPSEQCAIASDCAGEDTDCRIRVCVQGACGFADLPEDTPCEAARVAGLCDGAGTCLPAVDCSIASDCPGEDTQCRVRACVQGICGFADLPGGISCEISGINGTCNGMGVCSAAAECNIATDCPGVDSDCRTRACAEGVCGFDSAEAGATCRVDGLGGVCDGAGDCTVTQQCVTANDCPFESNPCRQGYCTAEGRCATRSTSGSCTIGRSTGECSGGTCRCPGQTQLCGDLCVNTNTDTSHCGRCNSGCNMGAGEVCRSGSCECPGEYDGSGDLCSGTCVSIETTQRCGSCTTSCGANEVCDPNGIGRAECECAPDHDDCGSGCVSLRSNTNCGECGKRCPSDTTCNGTQCVCSDSRARLCIKSGHPMNYFCIDPNSTEWSTIGCTNGNTSFYPWPTSCGRPQENQCP